MKVNAFNTKLIEMHTPSSSAAVRLTDLIGIKRACFGKGNRDVLGCKHRVSSKDTVINDFVALRVLNR